MSDENTLLQKLLKQEAALKQKIRQARRQEQKKKAQINNAKARIIGAAVLAEMETNPELKQRLQSVIDKHVNNDKDRKFIGLPPTLNNNENEKNQDQNPVTESQNNETASRSGFL